MDLIKSLADPSQLTLAEKISGGLLVAAVGMSITFLALLFLWLVIGLMSKTISGMNTSQQKPAKATASTKDVQPVAHVAQPKEEEDENLVAVITAAIAASLQTSIHQVVVTKIARVEEDSPAWAKSGRIEQINTRF